MSSEIVFYTHPHVRGRVIRWMLEELGQPYRTEVLGRNLHEGSRLLAINPMGKVPAIVHGDTVVTEGRRSAPIWRTRFPKPTSRRRPGSSQGPYYRWMFFSAGPLEAA